MKRSLLIRGDYEEFGDCEFVRWKRGTHLRCQEYALWTLYGYAC
jgi:hypothetical protein